MKKLLFVIALTLALNFLAAAGGIFFLFNSGKLDKEKVQKIKEMVFSPATQPAEAKPAAGDPATQPSMKLDALLARVAGRPAGEQVDFIQRTFDSQMTLMDAKKQELISLQNSIEARRKEVDSAQKLLKDEQAKLETARTEQMKAVSEQGFQDTLNLYSSMQAKQVKTIFMTLDDNTMIQYLRAMEPRVATKIVKEFKSPEENGRIAKVMEKMRQTQASVKE